MIGDADDCEVRGGPGGRPAGPQRALQGTSPPGSGSYAGGRQRILRGRPAAAARRAAVAARLRAGRVPLAADVAEVAAARAARHVIAAGVPRDGRGALGAPPPALLPHQRPEGLLSAGVGGLPLLEPAALPRLLHQARRLRRASPSRVCRAVVAAVRRAGEAEGAAALWAGEGLRRRARRRLESVITAGGRAAAERASERAGLNETVGAEVEKAAVCLRRAAGLDGV